MTEDHPDPYAIQGAHTLGPRWQEFRELNNDGAALIDAGELSQAHAKLDAAYRLTLVDDVDDAGLDARTRALANLAGLAGIQGETAAALDFAARALDCGQTVADAVGNLYGTVDTMVSVLTNRAQVLQLGGRLDEALTDLDTALARLDEHPGGNDVVLTFSLHNTKTTTLIAARRWQEAEAAARRTLEWAWEHAPGLTGHPYNNLAAIKQATGDHEAAAEYLGLASESQAASGNRSDHALATANRGRMALRDGDPATAMRLLLDAETGFAAVEDWWKFAETRYSRSVAALSSGDLDLALELLADVEANFAPVGNTLALAECHAIAADIATAVGDYRGADARYEAAQAIHQELGAGVDLAQLDVRWAATRYVQALEQTSPTERERLLRESRALAVPAALAVDALRHRFSPGPERERWISMVAAPAMSMAFTAVSAVNELPLIIDLLESAAATVSLHTEPGPPDSFDPTRIAVRQAIHTLQAPPVPEPTTDESPGAVAFTAAAFPGDDEPEPGFARLRLSPPPRLRTDPSRESALEEWIAVAEQRYRLPIRSDQEVRAW